MREPCKADEPTAYVDPGPTITTDCSPPIGTVADIPDAQLLERAVRGARSDAYGRRKHLRWVAVSEKFVLGSTYAHQLCRRFNLNPDEMVKR